MKIFRKGILDWFILSYLMTYAQKSLKLHEKYQGKISIISKVPLENKDELSTFYSPGVAAPCLEIAKNPQMAYRYTMKKNTIAIISDGSAVLGLGNIGALAGLPVMEGKAILFKKFGNVDAIPLVVDTQDPDEIIKFVEQVSPNFWGINLEDIAAPKCFYIEEALKNRLNIPVFHDDQHGTAIVVLAGLINAVKLKNQTLEEQKIVISWAGAAAIAIWKLLHKAGVQEILFVDSKGIISPDREDLNEYKKEVLSFSKNQTSWTLLDALKGRSVFIGVSKGNLLKAEDLKTMDKDPIIFALANPDPEISPEEAQKGGAFIVATWRSDYPNQINNLLAFPGIFRGALDAGITQITDEHKLAAAYALAKKVKNLSVDHILPSVFEEGIADAVSEAVKKIG